MKGPAVCKQFYEEYNREQEWSVYRKVILIEWAIDEDIPFKILVRFAGHGIHKSSSLTSWR